MHPRSGVPGAELRVSILTGGERVCCSEVEGSGEVASAGETCFWASVDTTAVDGAELKVG